MTEGPTLVSAFLALPINVVAQLVALISIQEDDDKVNYLFLISDFASFT